MIKINSNLLWKWNQQIGFQLRDLSKCSASLCPDIPYAASEYTLCLVGDCPLFMVFVYELQWMQCVQINGMFNIYNIVSLNMKIALTAQVQSWKVLFCNMAHIFLQHLDSNEATFSLEQSSYR